MRVGLRTILSGTEDVEVVGECGDGEEVTRLVERTRPDLLILGLDLTGRIGGVEACRQVKELSAPPRVLIHTACDFAEDLPSCYLAGADSYLHKRTSCERLVEAVRHVASGDRVWSVGEQEERGSRVGPAMPEGAALTRRERDVLALLLRRYSNAEISEALCLSLQTVKNHVSKVLRKVGVQSRRELFRRFS